MKTPYLKVGHTETDNVSDLETGEVVSSVTNHTYYLANSKEEFFLMYSSMILIMKNSSDVRMKLFAALLERYSKGQEFSMSKSLKIVIAEETGCKYRSLDVAFTYLLKERIVVKVASQLYKINPRHVFQGSSHDRNANLKAILELSCKTC